MIHPDSLDLKILLGRIEGQLGWGSSEQWTNYDFENLSETILESTSVNLSNTTLKRIWGKVKYYNDPSTATLNTLARFAGFMDWRSFKMSEHVEPEPHQDNKLKNPSSPTRQIGRRKFYWAGGSVGLFLVSYLFLSSIRRETYIDPAEFQFSANKILTVGVPNSVIFTYNAKAAKTDSVYIVQTWDIHRKTLVSRNDTHHSAIYYYPGYFRSKLIIDTTIVKTHDIQIATDGWLGIVEGQKPFYFSKEDIQRDSGVAISNDLLLKNNFALSPTLPAIRFFNQREMGNLLNNDFEFETKVRTDDIDGTNVCQYSEVLIQCKDDIIIIPLCARACVGDIGIYALGAHKEAKTADLSGFGADLSHWTTLKVTGHGKILSFYVNDSLATSLLSRHEPTGIVGIQYRFKGAAAIKDTWFKGAGMKWKF